MLTEIVVEDLGVIDRAEVDFTAGSSALTGETGAGKTLIVTALGLLVGGRADRTVVRAGAARARVEGRFVVPGDHPVVGQLDEPEIVDGSAEIILTRTIGSDGRSSARINGRLATLGALQDVGGELVELAGQNEHHRIASRSAQRELLDAFAGDDVVALATDVAARVSEWRADERAAEAARAGQAERTRELATLEEEISEIEAAAPVPGESDDLVSYISRLEHASLISEAIAGARDSLTSESGAVEKMASAASALEPAVGADTTLEISLERLRAAAIEVTDVAGDLASQRVDEDPGALENARVRLAALKRLHRRYGGDEAALFDYLARARDRRDEIARPEHSLEELDDRARAAEAAARESAASLSRRRAEAATRLCTEVGSLLGELALPGARFDVALEETDIYEGGAENVSFLVAINPGEPPRPISKVASGGELARISLALRLLTARASVPTMVFDEVDAGIGGEAARAVGRRLAELADAASAQVLVVTHLPQVAAAAEHHYRVTKVIDGERAGARVERLDAKGRIAEISRMLAGMPESARAREHAEELLAIAAGGPQ